MHRAIHLNSYFLPCVLHAVCPPEGHTNENLKYNHCLYKDKEGQVLLWIFFYGD